MKPFREHRPRCLGDPLTEVRVFKDPSGKVVGLTIDGVEITWPLEMIAPAYGPGLIPSIEVRFENDVKLDVYYCELIVEQVEVST